MSQKPSWSDLTLQAIVFCIWFVLTFLILPLLLDISTDLRQIRTAIEVYHEKARR